MVPFIDLDSAREIFSRRSCPWFNLLDEIDEQKGDLEFPTELDAALKSEGHDDYPGLYERWPQLLRTARAALERLAPDELVPFGVNRGAGKLPILGGIPR